MFLQLYHLLGKNKEIEHPAFGALSCSAIQDSHKRCIELMSTNMVLEIQCKSLYELSIQRYFFSLFIFLSNKGFQCYKAKNDADFKAWIDKQIDEKKALYKVLVFDIYINISINTKYLRENDSIIPDLQKKNVVQDLYTSIVEHSNDLDELYPAQKKENYINFLKDNIQFFDSKDE